jgi:predicted nucleic acid-binding Zn ribbon protein
MESLSSVLFSLYRGTPQHGEWVLACLQGAWSGIVGDRIARVSRPVSWNDYRLVIQVDDADWKQNLSALEGELLARVRSASGNEVRELSIKLNNSPSELI